MKLSRQKSCLPKYPTTKRRGAKKERTLKKPSITKATIKQLIREHSDLAGWFARFSGAPALRFIGKKDPVPKLRPKPLFEVTLW